MTGFRWFVGMTLRLSALTALLLATTACPTRVGPRESSGGEKGQVKLTAEQRQKRALVVANVGQDKITVGMLEDELNRQNPYVRMRFASDERRKDFLKNMVRFEVLAREARRRKLEGDPEVVRRVKRVMIDRMMEQLRSTLVKLEDVTAADVQAYYTKNKTLYQQPPKVRASMIVVKTRQAALALMQKAKQKPSDVRFFGDLVKDHSIDADSKGRMGDLKFFAKGDPKIPTAAAEAAFAITNLWALGGPVQLEQGWAVLMKTGEMEAVNRPLELEKNRIKNRLFNERRLKAVEKFVKELQDKAKTVIVKKNLSEVKVNLSPGRGKHLPGHAH